MLCIDSLQAFNHAALPLMRITSCMNLIRNTSQHTTNSTSIERNAVIERKNIHNNPVPPRSRGDQFDTRVPRDAVNRETLPAFSSNDQQQKTQEHDLITHVKASTDGKLLLRL